MQDCSDLHAGKQAAIILFSCCLVHLEWCFLPKLVMVYCSGRCLDGDSLLRMCVYFCLYHINALSMIFTILRLWVCLAQVFQQTACRLSLHFQLSIQILSLFGGAVHMDEACTLSCP